MYNATYNSVYYDSSASIESATDFDNATAATETGFYGTADGSG